ncbi:MAG: hypothetical protein MJ200_05650 [Mycoplasmoidaceae bacterium]|nr:hypothetical protein [Mycoplasmoidaceae bacterium]
MQTNPSLAVILSTSVAMVLLMIVPFIPGLNYGLQFVQQPGVTCHLNPWFWLALLGIILGYIVLAEVTKRLYMKVNHRE